MELAEAAVTTLHIGLEQVEEDTNISALSVNTEISQQREIVVDCNYDGKKTYKVSPRQIFHEAF